MPTREGPRDDLFAAMPPPGAKKALFAFVAGVREGRRERGFVEVKQMFVDVKKAHLNVRCDEEEWVELPNELVEPVRKIAVRHEESRVGVGKLFLAKTDDGRVQKRQRSIHEFLPSRNASESRRARGRLHIRRNRVGVEEY